MTAAQKRRINGYYWVEHLGPKQFAVKDADGAAGSDLVFETRREAEQYILRLQAQDDEATY